MNQSNNEIYHCFYIIFCDIRISTNRMFKTKVYCWKKILLSWFLQLLQRHTVLHQLIQIFVIFVQVNKSFYKISHWLKWKIYMKKKLNTRFTERSFIPSLKIPATVGMNASLRIQYTPYNCLLKNLNFSIKTTNN